MVHPLRLILAFAALTCLSASAYAQHKMLLLSGREVNMKEYCFAVDEIHYTLPGPGRAKKRSVDRYDVFSISSDNGKEDILYTPIDSLDFTVEEARQFIAGEQAGRKYHLKKGSNEALAAAVGIGSGFLGFYSLPVPMIYSVVVGRFNPTKMRMPEGVDTEIRSTEAYRMGYDKGVRNIRIQRAMKWGYIGLGAGLTGLIVYGVSTR